MKKIYLFSALVLAAFVSCQTVEKENPYGPETAKVPMTFNATISLDEELENADASKLEVGTVDTENKKLTFAWKKGDRIAVYDNLSSTPNVFTADEDGARTSFSGTVSEGATRFIAIYPYSAAISANVETGACEIDFPREQTAVAGSFDPEALVSVGSAEITGETPNPSIRFRLIGALLSFSVDYDNVVYAEFSGSRPMTGRTTFNNPVGASSPGSVSTGTPNYKDVSLKAEKGSAFVKGETYYVSVRHTGSNSQDGFTAKLITEDAQVASRTGSRALQIARKTLYPLGRFSDANVTFAYDRYAVYNAGFDVLIAGMTYNKATDGDATLLKTGTNFKTGITGVIFLEASASITNSSEVTVTDRVVLASNDPAHPATYTGTSGKSFLLKSGSLIFDNLIVDMAAMTSGQFITKKDNDSDADELSFYSCDVRNITRSVYTPNSSYLAKGVKNILFTGNRFEFDAASVKLIAISSGATSLASYEFFAFRDNVFYTSSATALNSQIFDTSASITDDSGTQALFLSNNLFYNIAASNGYFRSWNISSAEVTGNIAWVADGTDIGSNAKFLKFGQPTNDNKANYAGTASDNYCYGTLAGGKSWTIADAKDKSGLSNVTTLDMNPIASFDTATGAFTLVDEYKEFGPQIQPL